MRVHVFGTVGAFDGDGRVLSVGGPKQRTVLAMLCVELGRPVSADRLVEAVWGDEVPDRASRSLSTYVSSLRRELGDVIESGSGSYVLRLDRSQVDSCAFSDAVDAAGQVDGADGVNGYRDALLMWTGAPFGGLDGFGAFRDETLRLRGLRLVAERAVVEADIASGDAVSVVPRIEVLIREFPFDEGLRGLHMRALYRSGRQAEALASFNSFKSQLAEGLGLDPSPELRSLELQILQQDESLDVGHRGTVGLGVAAVLPNRYSSFVGRQSEVTETRDRLVEHRLVSLVGPGGIGKSSIALEAAKALQSSDVTVVQVPIESVGAGEAAHSIARSIGLEPAGGVDPVDVISGYLATRPHVIVLDGCEAHITEVAHVADRLLSVTDCTLLATSREPLGLNGESTIRIDPLPIETAIELFRDRAQLPHDVDEGTLEIVRSVCLAVDGMPLAVELAAARARTVPLDRLAERLGDQIPLLRRARSFDERHGSLLAALDWSYDLLDNGEQVVLLALSIFVTPFTLADAAAMIDQSGVEDDVARLVEVSFLQPSDSSGEYRFLEPIRQYARHKLTTSGDFREVTRRHTEWIVLAAKKASDEQWSPRKQEVLAWIFKKRHEILAVVERALEADDPDTALTIFQALAESLYGLGIHGPFTAPGEAALHHPRATHNHNYVMASAHISMLVRRDGRGDDARAILTHALAIAEETDDLIGQGEVKHRLAFSVALHDPDLDPLEFMDDALELLNAGGRPNTERLLYNRATLLTYAGQFEEAAAAVEEHRVWWEATMGGPFWGYSGIMGEVRGIEGAWESALNLYEEAATIAEAESTYFHAAGYWEGAGVAAVRTGSPDRLHAAAERHHRITEMTGTDPSIYLGIEVALTDEDFDTVLRLADQWFTVTAADPEGDYLLISPDAEQTIYGSSFEQPRIFAILRPVAAALMATGRPDEACRIINVVPSLIEQSPFEYWTEYRETELWEPLQAACRDNKEPDTEPLTLPLVFDFVREVVNNRATVT
jgi:predicted ATPase/DNA-binding SARP family transcriptional activator